MKANKYKQLVDVHLQHRIWRNELEMSLMEIDFWEDVLEKHARELTEIPVASLSHLHHYQRLAQQLLADLQQQEQQVATGVQKNRVLLAPTLADYDYLREQMDTFRGNFQLFKNEIRRVATARSLPAVPSGSAPAGRLY